MRDEFSRTGIATFEREREAMDALAQLADHSALLRKKAVAPAQIRLRGDYGLLNEAESLALLSEAGLPVIEHRLRERVGELGAWFDAVIVARKARKGREMALGARIDPQFGPVVLVGEGGVYLEALKDFRLLIPPFFRARRDSEIE